MKETKINIKGLVIDLKTNNGIPKFREKKTKRFILHFNKTFKRKGAG
jgi:hypothetical protein